ncbi:sugar isomerase, partial [Streptomyces sp. SID14478]|nr:sugar isomerase [Streptomyces sp. SID14478]
MSGSRITFQTGQDTQPEALERIAAHLRAQLDAVSLAGLRSVQRPLFTGIGASYAALAVPVDVLRAHGVAAQRVLADEVENGLTGFDTDLLIGVSQGGRSSETLAAFKAAGTASTLAVLNVTPSPLGDLAELTVDLGNEPDSYASTVGFTGTVVALDLLAGAIAGRTSDPWHGIGPLLRTVRERATAALAPVRA